MEAFSLLKYWRGGGGVPVTGATAADTPSATERTPNGAATTILTAVAQNAIETDDDDDDDGDGDDGPFFDLEFTVPDVADDDSEDGHGNPNGFHSGRNTAHQNEEDEGEDEGDDDDNDESEGDDGEREFKFTLSPSSNDRSDPNLSLSPSDDLFFKGKLVQLEPSSFVLNSSEPTSKPQFTASLLKSATRFRVFMLGLKKSKSSVASDKDTNGSEPDAPNPKQEQESQKKQPAETQQKKLFTVKFKVEEIPIMSLFTRDNSSRGVASANKSSTSSSQNQKPKAEESPPSSASDEKRFSTEVMQKYLKMVKPLYIRVSRRYGYKLRFSGQLNLSPGPGKDGPPPATAALKPSPAKAESEKAQMEGDAHACETTETNMKGKKQGNLPAGLRVVCKHLGKSRSASSAVASSPSGLVSSRRRDDSLLQQQDGIQGAILHCKRSFNASRECGSSQLPRSASDSLHEISPETLSRKSTNEDKNKHL